MDKGKIKNIIIIVLLLVNVFLAALVVADSARSGVYDAAAERSLLQALQAGGITVDDASVLNIRAIPACTLTRNLSREKRLVAAVLGSVDSQDQGGNIVMYYGKNGQACFRGTGDFEILMENDSVPAGSDLAETSRAFLKKLGIDMDAAAATVRSGSSSVVTAVCRYADRPIVNCVVKLTFSETNLLLVTGTCPLTAVRENAGSAALDPSTAVMRLLDYLDSSGYVCSRITDISHCYKMDAAASGEGTLTPLWHFSTDVGEFYLNGITGKAETVTQNN